MSVLNNSIDKIENKKLHEHIQTELPHQQAK